MLYYSIGSKKTTNEENYMEFATIKENIISVKFNHQFLYRVYTITFKDGSMAQVKTRGDKVYVDVLDTMHEWNTYAESFEHYYNDELNVSDTWLNEIKNMA